MNKDISSIANLVKNKKGIDATMGMLMDEDKNIIYAKAFKEEMFKLSDSAIFPYAGITLSKNLEEGISNWLNLSHYSIPYEISMTMGATGALSQLFSLYQNVKRKQILIPNLSWSNYDNIAETHGYDVFKYQLFNEKNTFDIKSFEKLLRKLIVKKGITIIILNFPAHNPTGYTLTKEELAMITKIINVYHSKHHPLKIAFDITYNEYDDMNINLTSLKRGVDKYFIYSFSKSMGLYGLRIGMLIYFSYYKNNLFKFVEKTKKLSRTTWGSSNNGVLNALEMVLTDNEKVIEMKENIEKNICLLNKRANLFLENIDEKDLYPYNRGFYITIKTKNATKMLEYLFNNNVYAVEVDDGIRFSIARLSEKEIKQVIKVLKRYLE